MKRHILVSALALALVLSMQFIGCGDDDKPTKPKTQADPNDPSYLTATYLLSSADGGVGSAYMIALIDFWKIKWGDQSDLVYHPASGFWYEQDFQIDTIYSEENPYVIINTTQITIRDSVRFWHGSTAVQNPDSAQLTRIEAGLYIYGDADSTDDVMTASYILNITGPAGEIWSDGDVTVNGTGTMDGIVTQIYYREPDEPRLDSLGICKVVFDIASSFPALAINLDDVFFGCPHGGTINSTGPISVEYCPGADENLEFPATWTSKRTFNADNITIVTNSPTRQWTRTETCENGLFKKDLNFR